MKPTEDELRAVESRRRRAANRLRYRERHPERGRVSSREWRQNHPDQYRVSHTRRQAAWRKEHPEAANALTRAYRQRRRYREHPERVLPDALKIVGPPTSTLTYLYDPLRDDLIGVASLALIEGRDAAEAVKEYRSRELSWGRKTREFPEGFEDWYRSA